MRYKSSKWIVERKGFWIAIVAVVVLLIGAAVTRNITGDLKRETVVVTVKDKQIQQLIKSSGSSLRTEIRYLVFTDKEMFVVENSIMNGAYNNSEIYMSLDTGKQYTLTVCGYGKSIITEYRNIVKIQHDNSNNRQ